MASYTLLELNTLIRKLVEGTFDDEYWVQGELLDARVASGGHFYGELIQKEEKDGRIVARAKVNCWARQFGILHMRFCRETGETLHSGIKVMALVRVTFHEQYGYALNIQDIDPSYTLGDMMARRKEILAQLEADGIIDDNKTLPMPRLANRIAVISSDTAAGYGDFRSHLVHNPYGLRFRADLFPAVLQGANTPDSIMQAVEDVLSSEAPYHALVIIRGGGATGDLSDFDNYPLASCIAQCPIPVIVGIGHERDHTVLDFVAHTRVKTPTAAADFLITHQKEELELLEAMAADIKYKPERRIEQERQKITRFTALLPYAFARVKERAAYQLDSVQKHITDSIRLRMERERNRLSMMASRTDSISPARLLRLGYSITWCGDKVVKSSDELKPGDVITTQLMNGTVTSKVELTNKENEEKEL